MERAYREDELLDSIVVDSEGYIYGTAGKIDIKEDEIELLVYETKLDERTTVDIDKLVEELQRKAKTTFIAKIQRLSTPEILARDIQKEFNLTPEEPLTDQHYMKYAEKLGIETPYKKVTEERKEPKGVITLSEVKSIKTSTIGTERSRVIKIILLHEPKEARFRKIPIQKTVPYRITETIKNKLVIDPSGRAVGYVDSIVLFSDKPGLRIYTSKPTDSVSLGWLFKHLEKIGRPDIIEAITKHLKIRDDAHIYRVGIDELEDFMTKTKLTFKIPETAFVEQSTKEFVMDIPWDLLDKIGDVVLLRQTFSELKSKGY